MSNYLLAIDQGTTSTRAILFDKEAKLIAQESRQLTQHYPKEGWVEHDPEEIWQHTQEVVTAVLKTTNTKATAVATIGITNQRETTVVWSKATGKPIHPAIVWQDRRTADKCAELLEQGLEKMVTLKTGLLLDPYFSATKIQWILNNVPNARTQAEAGELAFGTVDSYLLWKLTAGKVHATDTSNAARTLLYNIHQMQWDEELLRYFDIPKAMLPSVKETADDFGKTDAELFGDEISINAMVGDQQAATFGQACFDVGEVKSTFGTGCFLMMNTGSKLIKSQNRLLTTVLYTLNGETTYALEGSVFVAGAAVQWLRDTVKLIQSAEETASLAEKIADTKGVYLVPAFTGLGAPFWDPLARGAILGLTRDSGVEHIVRAALESVCYQVKDLLLAMEDDAGTRLSAIHVDGGMVVNDWLMQFLSDILDSNVTRPVIHETTALGAALLAGYKKGIYQDLADIKNLWQLDKEFEPDMDDETRQSLYQGWLEAVSRIRSENKRESNA